MVQKEDRMQRIKKGIGTGDRWDMVRLENGIIGYISQNYVEELPDVEIEKIEVSLKDNNDDTFLITITDSQRMYYINEDGIVIDDSNILKQTVSYLNELDLVKKEQRSFNDQDELIATCNQEPKCIGVNCLEDKVVIEVEKEISLSVVGKTTIRVETKNEMESWDEFDNITIDENFIK